MTESYLIPFAFWSAITGILIVISGLSYRTYLRRRKNETFAP
ncbi:MAG: hypothetical protein V3T67_02270 [Nitrosopumilaceae archaeon]